MANTAFGSRNTPVAPLRQARVTFVYLGTAHAFAGFVSELARASTLLVDLKITFIVAANRPASVQLQRMGVRTFSVPGVDVQTPLSVVRAYFRARERFINFLDAEQPDLVISLMPHIWSPFLASVIKRRCRAYVTLIHDAVPHPGDRSGCVTRWLLWDARRADCVVTLSNVVAAALAHKRIKRPDHILPLFHPYLTQKSGPTCRKLGTGQTFRLLFFGRILAYKGLPLLVEAIEILKHRGMSIVLGVAGAGDIARLKTRLAALGANVINRTLSNDEVAELLTKYDAMVCSHIEASQSGVAALAFGSCMPVVATPVGGLVEQVIPGQTGVLAANVTAPALADAIQELISVPHLYDQISRHLKETYRSRSMETFLGELIAFTLPSDFHLKSTDVNGAKRIMS